jgi:hypothetical protein
MIYKKIFFATLLISFSFLSIQTSSWEKISWEKLSNNEKGFVVGGGLLFAFVAGCGIYYFFYKEKKTQHSKEKVEKFNTDFLNLNDDREEIEILEWGHDGVTSIDDRKWIYGIKNIDNKKITLLKHYLLHNNFTTDCEITAEQFCITKLGCAKSVHKFTLKYFEYKNININEKHDSSEYDLYALNNDTKSEEIKFEDAIADFKKIEDKRNFIAGMKNKNDPDKSIIFTIELKGNFKGCVMLK